jgi:hypothetical protein
MTGRTTPVAVGLEPANTRAVAGARIDDDKGRSFGLMSMPAGGMTAQARFTGRPGLRPYNQFDLVVEHVRRVFGKCSRY